jgi:serine protease Do
MRTNLETDLAALAATLGASTVAVRSRRGGGSGSGVVWSADGTIVTNAHVAQTKQVEIELVDGRHLPGTVERRDVGRDLASVRVAAVDLVPARYRDPRDLRVGEFVAAFGHPLGVRNVLSTGIVHAVYRSGSHRFVRADVRLEPGNSGGALADAEGRVVGINSMVAGGLALAIPADAVRRFLDASATGSRRLGVRLAPVELAGREPAYAVLATEPDSAADRSGIIAGDIIVTRDVAGLAAAPIVAVVRGGVSLTIAIVPARSEAAAAA